MRGSMGVGQKGRHSEMLQMKEAMAIVISNDSAAPNHMRHQKNTAECKNDGAKLTVLLTRFLTVHQVQCGDMHMVDQLK